MRSDSELVTRNPKMTLRERWQKKPAAKPQGTVAEEAQRISAGNGGRRSPAAKPQGTVANKGKERI